MEMAKEAFGYMVKYGKSWKAKQAAFDILYGGWEESYNCLAMVLKAMAAENPSVAFKHCRPIMSVDGTFLTGYFKGTLLIIVARNDGGDKLVPLAFTLVSAENNSNWEWFLHVVRIKVIGPQREVCIISDRHPGILNAVEIDIPGHPRVHHRWCMRYFVSKFYQACGDKELSDLLQDCCLTFTTRHFEKLWDKVYAKANNGGKDFLNRNLADKGKWARALDNEGVRYGDMTNNMAKCFNMVLKGICALLVTAIVEYIYISEVECPFSEV
ncbi:uncharacterized protein [Aegilops tauschii subsp. strangulata]|uniref:uncharacterized protein n=1 Tax=Aegilops tauschii subsp. strangulata TaxID=200361 RepID=UPI00098B8179|nr:uncharacterized protein LOC109733504 [Aegilops tauschii subsp. strangulata]